MKAKKLFFLINILVFFFSCQKEENILVQNATNLNIKPVDPIISLLLRVSQNPTGFDNIIDNSSCFSVNLPVNVVVNGQNLTILNQNSLTLITDAQNNFPGDDVVNINFPITITYQNYETQLVTSVTQFTQIKNSCTIKNDGFDELSCLNFNFPLSINTFNTNSQLANTLVFANNSNLFNYINNLDPNDLFQFNFPIQIINSAGQNISINDNLNLNNFIIDQIDDCTGVNNTVLNPNLTPTLTSGTWVVSYYYDDDDDETDDYITYQFVFNSNNTITVTNGANVSINNTWNAFFDASLSKLTLVFENSNLDKLDNTWRVLEINMHYIHLKSLNDDNETFLNFRKL